MRRLSLPLLLLTGTLTTSGCAQVHRDRAAVAPAAVDVPIALDGVVVRPEPEPLTQLDIYDPETLFHLALEADRNDNHERARQLYGRLLDEFPDSRLLAPARFNLGLLAEHDQAWLEAAEFFRAVALEALPTQPAQRATWLHAHFRLAVVAGKAGDWWRAVGAFDRVLEQEWLDDDERLEALVGRGIALQEAGDPESAEIAFAAALRHFRQVRRRQRLDDRGLAAEAAFRMGEIASQRYRAVELAYPQDVLRESLERKCEQLLAAQSRYLRAMYYGDAHTVALAGLRIGGLYETLHDTIVSLEAPADLDDEQEAIYDEEVRDRVGILVKKALIAYERSLTIGRRAPTAEPWVRRLEAAIERLRTAYLDRGGAS